MSCTQRDPESLISINHRVKKSCLIATEHIPLGANQVQPEVMEKGLSIPCLWLAGWNYQLCWVCKAQHTPDTLPRGSCPHQPLLALPKRKKTGHVTDHGHQNIRKNPHIELYFASKSCTWQGRSTKWGGANRHGTESTTLASAANTKVSQLVNRLRFTVAG